MGRVRLSFYEGPALCLHRRPAPGGAERVGGGQPREMLLLDPTGYVPASHFSFLGERLACICRDWRAARNQPPSECTTEMLHTIWKLVSASRRAFCRAFSSSEQKGRIGAG